MSILLLFACVLALVLINVPIAVALGIVAVTALLATQGLGSLPNLPIVLYNGAAAEERRLGAECQSRWAP